MQLPAMPWSRRSRAVVARVRGGAGWPDNAERVTVTARGPHPIAVATVAAIDRTDGLGLRGESGAILSAWPQSHGYLRTLRVLSPVGDSLNLRASPNTALPGTVVPVNAQGPIMSLLAQIPSSRGA